MATCKSCGMSVVWATTADGTRLQLEPTPALYLVQHDSDGVVRALRIEQQPDNPLMVDHYEYEDG